MADQIIFSYKTPLHPALVLESENTADECFEPPQCEICYHTKLPSPLSIKSFDVIQEWCCNVALQLQVQLETFINTDTIRKKQDPLSNIRTQLERLYGIYDILLNTMNQKHIGILQQANTNELLMHYNSVVNLFAVTSKAGVTTSFKTAENQLKARAMDDVRYYETYLQPQPINYDTMAGSISGSVNMRQCHVIFMLDNLVRLKTQEDPSPGDSRSRQLCTLPITLQGTPKDAAETELWHQQDICDGTNDCRCKQPHPLQREDIKPALLELSPPQQDALQRFTKLCTWSTSTLWKQIGQGMYNNINK